MSESQLIQSHPAMQSARRLAKSAYGPRSPMIAVTVAAEERRVSHARGVGYHTVDCDCALAAGELTAEARRLIRTKRVTR